MSRIKPKTRRNKVRALIERDGGFCHYCCRKLPAEIATLDHITPVAKGGSNHNENLVLSCRWCNEHKGTKRASEFRAHVRAILASGGKIGPIDWKCSKTRKARRRIAAAMEAK